METALTAGGELSSLWGKMDMVCGCVMPAVGAPCSQPLHVIPPCLRPTGRGQGSSGLLCFHTAALFPCFIKSLISLLQFSFKA